MWLWESVASAEIQLKYFLQIFRALSQGYHYLFVPPVSAKVEDSRAYERRDFQRHHMDPIIYLPQRNKMVRLHHTGRLLAYGKFT